MHVFAKGSSSSFSSFFLAPLEAALDRNESQRSLLSSRGFASAFRMPFSVVDSEDVRRVTVNGHSEYIIVIVTNTIGI